MTRSLRVHVGAPPRGARVRRDGLDVVRDEVSERLLDAARREGFEAGRAEAEETAARALLGAAGRLDDARTRAEESLPREVLELAVEIADQLVKVRLADGAYDLERIVRSALAGGGIDRGRCQVHLHPDDLARLEGVRFREDTELLANPDLPRGTVHVETPRGLLVRDPVESLEQIRENLLEGLV